MSSLVGTILASGSHDFTICLWHTAPWHERIHHLRIRHNQIKGQVDEQPPAKQVEDFTVSAKRSGPPSDRVTKMRESAFTHSGGLIKVLLPAEGK
ncbi:MAG: hypothetical protein MK106_01640 [Mariniblastus sp.]|nr:hypothetical protein [Mariniblastus sp.]